ncbi:hypothetical protein H2203_004912 [Taxawa tesnikishii (nom. ined.)]|nr:hypothetical protein H2203_004912 [Dothideales sp. JES 119]
MDQSQSPGERPRARSRGISFRSDKSSGSKPKVDISETAAEKARRDSIWKGGSKANPNAAMSEAQPGVDEKAPVADTPKAAAVFEKSTLASLRSIEHKDADGNPITDPDLSNPTRPRWERPLDTIRSFERAIDGDYKRKSMSRAASYDPREHFAGGGGGGHSRRSSYYGGGYNHSTYQSTTEVLRAPGYDSGSQVGGYYANRRPDSYYDNSSPIPSAPPTRNRYGQRVTSDTLPRSASQMGSRNGFYPQHGYQQSHDTVYTNGSDSTGPWANSTDPTSSENSSIDKMHANGKRVSPQPVDNYGYDGYNGNTIREEYGQDNEAGVYGGPSGYNGVSAVPSHAAPAPAARAPIKLGGGVAPLATLPKAVVFQQ